VGITTCYKNAIVSRAIVGERPLTAPWWVGIKTEEDMNAFFEGGREGKGEYWGKRYLYYQQDPELVETVVTVNPWDYGDNEERNFVARVRVLPMGDQDGEMTLGTLKLRDLEGQIARANLILFRRKRGMLTSEITVGENYQHDPIAESITGGVVRKVFYEWAQEPTCLADYFDAIKLRGFDIIELIGEYIGSYIRYLMIFEVR